MMIFSRIWYVILAILLAAAYYVVALAVGQYNRRNEAAMSETIKADSQVVNWALQVDARRRLDGLLLAAVDPKIGAALRAANGKETIPATSKDEAARQLRAFNEKLPADYKNDALFVADKEGRLVGQVGYDVVNAAPEFELGGYPAVFDALHGFLRDDTWVWNGKIARVVTRPVEDEVGQPPLGAVIALKWVDSAFAKQMATRTRTNLAFFALGSRVASAATTEGFEEKELEGLGPELKSLGDDKGPFREAGRTEVRPLGDAAGVVFVRLPGDASELGAGFAVARPKVAITGPLGFLSGADDQDKKNVKLWVVALIVLGAALFGLLFSYFEHSMPVNEMGSQAAKLKRGEMDVLNLPKLRGGLRSIGADINAGIQRVVEKGGGTARKPADLESILGPVPAQPSMSAFSFPMADGSMAPHTPSGPGGAPPAYGAPPGGPNQRFGAPPPQASPSRPNPGPPPPNRPGPGGFNANQTVAMGNAPPPPFNQTSPMGNKMATAPTAPAPFPSPAAAMAARQLGEKEEEATMVAQPSADLIAASGAHPAVDPAAEWHSVYDEFIRTKRECGEPTDGLTFEKFQQTLKKNRDALMQRHGCKRVKFSVYVKEGRASLKATPVRD